MPGSFAVRFEFRIFGRDLSPVRAQLQARGTAYAEERREDLYILERGRSDAGLKLRGGAAELDLKRLVRVVGPCELWMPAGSADLPLSGAEIQRRFLRPAGVPDCLAPDSSYDREALLAALRRLGSVRTMSVAKRRWPYDIGPDLGEWSELTIAGDRQEHSVALESTDALRLRQLVAAFGLGGRPNTSFPRHLQQLAFSV